MPVFVRRILGVESGDRVEFAVSGDSVTIRAFRPPGKFAKYAKIGNPGLALGRRAVVEFVRQLRDG